MNECPVIVRGTHYASQSEAAKAIGVSPNAVSQHLSRHGHCESLGLGPGRLGNTNAKANRIVIFGHVFRSHLAASKALGVHRSRIRRFASGELKQAAREDLYLAVMRYAMTKKIKSAIPCYPNARPKNKREDAQ